MIATLADHLWQSTASAAAIAVLALALRANRPQVRYALWLAASLKFLVPFAALAAVGARVGWWSPATVAAPPLTRLVDSWEAVGQPFSRPAVAAVSASMSAIVAVALPAVLLAVWLCGCAAIVITWAARWRRITRIVRAAASIEQGRELGMLRRLEHTAQVKRPIRLVSSETELEPGVFGIRRPVLLWPRRIADHLDDCQAEAILAHEVIHVARRDNLAATLHMAVQAIFWFHPLVWWIGARLVDERERACDAEVLRLGSDPRVYAESILKTCELCMESPLVCVSGVTGSDLKKRIEQIMKNEAGAALTVWRKMVLTGAAVAAIAVPIAVGVLSPSRVRAQSAAPDDSLGPPFATVSITSNTSDDLQVRPWVFDHGRFAVKNMRVRNLILYAYQLNIGRISGGPPWTQGRNAESFDIEARANGDPSSEELRAMVRRLLADKFGLIAHRETREQPTYALALARSDAAPGPRLRTSACTGKTAPPPGPSDPAHPIPLPCGAARSRTVIGTLEARWLTMDEFADWGLSPIVGRAVRNRTGLSGHFDLDAAWTPDTRPPGPHAPGVGPATFTAIEEQLGLRLTEETGAVELFVIDRIERPVQP